MIFKLRNILLRYRMVYHKNLKSFRRDGLNSIKYELIAIINKPLYKLVSISLNRIAIVNVVIIKLLLYSLHIIFISDLKHRFILDRYFDNSFI